MSLSKQIEEAIQSGDKVLLDFYKENCAPCKMIEKQLENIQKNHTDIKVFKILFNNSEEEDALFTEYSLKSVPALFLYKNKQLIATLGAVPVSKILDCFNL